MPDLRRLVERSKRADADAAASVAQRRSRSAGKRITSRIESLPAEHHREPVDADAEAAGRRHPVRERLDVVRVARLGLDVAAGALGLPASRSAPACSSESLISVNALPSSMPPTKYSKRSTIAVLVAHARERRELDRVVVEDRRLDQVRLDEVRERVVDELRPGLVVLRVDVAGVEPRAQLGLVARPQVVLVERVDELEPPPGRRQVDLVAAERRPSVVPTVSRRPARRASRSAPSCPRSRRRPRTTRAS